MNPYSYYPAKSSDKDHSNFWNKDTLWIWKFIPQNGTMPHDNLWPSTLILLFVPPWKENSPWAPLHLETIRYYCKRKKLLFTFHMRVKILLLLYTMHPHSFLEKEYNMLDLSHNHFHMLSQTVTFYQKETTEASKLT